MTPGRDNEFRVPPSRRRQALINGLCAVAEYLSQPLGLLIAAPYLLRHLGSSQFGIWVLASAAVNSGNLFASGFGDAAVRFGSMYRGRSDLGSVITIVRGMITINLALSGLLAISFWGAAPYAADHISHIEANLRFECLQSLRIGSLLLVVRSLDNVFASTLRALERYSPSSRIAIVSRIGVLVAAIALVSRGFGVVEIMLATLVISLIAVVAQALAVRSATGRIVLLPSLHRKTLIMIAGFGGFSWLQAISAIVFGQVDRLIVGIFLGAPAVACYALCAQAAQTIHGIVGSGLHVLFPHLSARFEAEPAEDLRHTIWVAFKANLVAAVLLGAPIMLLSRPILSFWLSPEFARQAWPVLSILAASFALFALNVTAHYALLALGEVRLVTAVSLFAGVAMLLLMLLLTPTFGILGTASARLISGPITWTMYLPLHRIMRNKLAEPPNPSPLVVWESN